MSGKVSSSADPSHSSGVISFLLFSLIQQISQYENNGQHEEINTCFGAGTRCCSPYRSGPSDCGKAAGTACSCCATSCSRRRDASGPKDCSCTATGSDNPATGNRNHVSRSRSATTHCCPTAGNNAAIRGDRGEEEDSGIHALVMENVTFRGWAAGVLLVLIIAEMVWSWRNNKKVYRVKETLANLGVMVGFQLTKLLFTGYQLALLGWAYRYRIWDFDASWGLFVICFVVADFVYYWFHRISHVWRPLWAFHLTHHSSTMMNLTTAYRLNWFSAVVTPFFYVPMALLGFPPLMIALSVGLNLFYQFFLHTEAIGKLGPLEGLLDTPSAHRVHHGTNRLYLDKNFGGVLMIWDRLFGTYQPETEKVRYGITSGFVSYNPFTLVLHGFVDLFRGKMKSKE